MSAATSRWVTEFQRQITRRKHVVLYGNIHDQFLWRGSYLPVHDVLAALFAETGFELYIRYDPVDGLQFDPPSARRSSADGAGLPDAPRERFDELVRRGMPGLTHEQLGQEPIAAPRPTPPADPTAPPARVVPGAGRPPDLRRMPADEAFGAIRSCLAQSVSSVAAVIDLGDMLTTDPARYSADERGALMRLHRCMLEALPTSTGPARGYRNTVVLLAGDLGRVPAWVYHENPYVALVQAARPDRDERKQFALSFLRPVAGAGLSGFCGGDGISDDKPVAGGPSPLDQVAEEFADLTDGFQAIDLEALRHTSWQAKLPVGRKQMARLIDFFKFGLREDPWESLGVDKVTGATEILGGRVIGQPKAVRAVTDMLTAARVGVSMAAGSGSGKPKGVFFFVGPTGVGKTELAKAVTHLVFGDERSFARFDMSEYKEEHAAEKLAGAPPGFVGYEEGGQLTNRVLERPHSILLFDEIEKAHPRVLDKFLQILEDGRLTDGKGQTAYFHQTAIIFTSNIGASDQPLPYSSEVRPGIIELARRRGAADLSYAEVERHFRDEVNWYFTSRIGRAELLNRFGDNIVVFDILRPQYVDGIADKFLKQLAEAGREKYRLDLRFDASLFRHLRARMEEEGNLLFGGRRIKSLLETLVERPLNRRLFEAGAALQQAAGRIVTLRLTDDGALEVEGV
jgi:hypothetical protein